MKFRSGTEEEYEMATLLTETVQLQSLQSTIKDSKKAEMKEKENKDKIIATNIEKALDNYKRNSHI